MLPRRPLSAPGTRRLELVADAERFDALAGPWRALAESEPLPFGAHWWLTTWWRAFGEGRELRVWVAWEGDALVAALPLATEGGRWSAIANVHTPVFRPLAADAESLRAVVGAAVDAAPGRIALPSLPAGDPALGTLEAVVRERGGWTATKAMHVSPLVDTTGDFDDWRARTRHSWGAPLERFGRKMARDHDARFVIVEPPEDLDRELAEGFAVEGSGWKGRAGTAVLSNPDTAVFYEGIAHAAHAAGELRLSRIELDGRTVAFDLCLLRDGRLYLLKTGFDEEARRLAPGLVMRMLVIRRCFELGLQAHELLGDDSEWKRKFATGDREHVQIDGYLRRPGPAAAYAWRTLARPRLKRVLRAVRPA